MSTSLPPIAQPAKTAIADPCSCLRGALGVVAGSNMPKAAKSQQAGISDAMVLTVETILAESDYQRPCLSAVEFGRWPSQTSTIKEAS
ncbi:MAG: hypothetical protein R3B95_07745 [Nitrospirales bacterium]|nr:hypothetical protein [Nitrospirales bacterium]